MSCRRHIRACCMLTWGILLWAASLPAQLSPTVEEGPLQKKHLHERFLRLVRGGDGNFYAFKGSAGHYWQFGAEGERSLQLIRLDPSLNPVDTLKIKRLGPADRIKNVYDVLVAPDGIGLLSIAKGAAGGMPVLQLCRPTFGEGAATLQCERLADMPGLIVGLDKPNLRIAYSPDSSHILLAWRRLAKEEESDRSLSCMILDRDLRVVEAPFSPFKQFQANVWLKEMLILDAEHLLFTAQTLQAGNVLTGPSTISYGILHYAVTDDELRVIRFRNTKDVPVETRLGLTDDGQLLAAGWYIDQREERCLAGVFVGRITGADTLEDLHQYPFSEPLRAAVIRQEKRSGAIGIRTGFHSTLLSTADSHAFILHLRGEIDSGLEPAAPGNRANNTLHCWTFDRSLELVEHSMSGFYNVGREDFMETFSWRPLQIGGAWHALATDYSKVRHENMPAEAGSFVWHLPGSDFTPLAQGQHKRFCLLAPREMVKVGADEWVGMAVAGNRWRLVRIRFQDGQ